MNFQMFKLDLEQAEKAKIKFETFIGLLKKQENTRKTSIFALFIMPKYLIVYHNKLWKILQEIGNTRLLTCLLRNLYAGQEAIVRSEHGTDWFLIEKGVCHGCILSPCLFNLGPLIGKVLVFGP